MIIENCLFCSEPFKTSHSELERGRKYCSLKCKYANKKKKVNRNCLKCSKSFEVAKYVVDKGEGRFCSRSCGALFRAEQERLARFIRNIVVLPGPDSCWIWTGGSPGYQGYGAMRTPGGRIQAHRYSYETFRGPIPKGKFVLHRCDHPPCCAPNHLWLGDSLANNLDAAKKGRKKSKLTIPQVIEILNQPDAPQIILAEKYGVVQCTISQIRNGHKWKHINRTLEWTKHQSRKK